MSDERHVVDQRHGSNHQVDGGHFNSDPSLIQSAFSQILWHSPGRSPIVRLPGTAILRRRSETWSDQADCVPKRIIQPKRCSMYTTCRNAGRTGEPTPMVGEGGPTGCWYRARNSFRDLSSSFSLSILIDLLENSVVFLGTQIRQQSCRRFGFVRLPAGWRPGKFLLSVQHRHLNLDFLSFGNPQILVKFDHSAVHFAMDCPGHH